MRRLPCWVFAWVLVLSCGPDPEVSNVPVRTMGTERMAERLQAIADGARPMKNTFMNRERLDLLQSVALPTDVGERFRAEYRLAKELLFAGESAQAVEHLERLAAQADEAPKWLDQASRLSVHSLLAVAYLRRGEQQNCLAHHSRDSCLLPIRGSGVYQQQDSARAAMNELALLLREDGDHLTNRWLYNVAAMAVGDYPEAVPDEWLIAPAAFESDHDIGRFYDQAPGVGLATVGLAGGSVVEDLDGDGRLDVMASSWGLTDPLHLFRNQPDGTFRDVTTEAGLEGITGGLNLVHSDYDNDGDADVLVLRGAWLGPEGAHPNSLLENRGLDADGRLVFADVTEEVGLLSFHPTQTAAWADFDNDGWLDLFIGNESTPGLSHPSEFYRNNGPGPDGVVTFSDVAAEAGLDVDGFVKAVVWGDYDNDGRPDLYISRLLGRNLLFRNESAPGSPSFREVGLEAGVAEPVNSFPAWFFDYDNDGRLDLFVSGYFKEYSEGQADDVAADYLGLPVSMERPRLFHNEGPGTDGAVTFRDVSVAAGLDHPLMAMGANFGDLDNDGYPDVYLGTGAPDFRALVPNRMFRNAEGRVFQDVTTSGGFGHLQKGHGISFGDLDNDGDQDIFAVMGGAYSGDTYQNALFVNPGHGNRWVTLRLEGVTSNRSAIGARLRLDFETPKGPRQVFSTVGTGGSFGSSSLQQELGLGKATAIRTLEVWWPGGDRQTFHDLPMERVVWIHQGVPEARVR